MVDLGEIQEVYYMVAATGVLVAAAYYVLNMRDQRRNMRQTLETRQAQIFLNINDKLQSKERHSAYSKVISSRWTNWEEYSKLYQEDKEFRDAENLVQGIYEEEGVLVREKLLPIRMVALLQCGTTRLYWEKHIPIMDEGRRVTGSRRLYSENEYLYDELIKYLEEHPELDNRIEAMP